MDIVEGHGPLRKIILKSGKIIVLETEEGVVEVLEAIRSGKAIKDALKGARKYRPYKPE